MSSTKLLILAVTVLGWLTVPALGAEEAPETAQVAEAAIAPSDQPDEPTDVQEPLEGATEVAETVPQGDPSTSDAMPDVAKPDAPLAAELADPAAAEAEVPAPLGVSGSESAGEALEADASEALDSEGVSPEIGLPEGEAEAVEVVDAQTPLEGPDTAIGPEPEAAGVSDADPDAVLPAAPRPALGAIGYDSQGRRGRVHVVQPSDTLWDISDAYLGTPWVWPSIWDDNRKIANPHVIEPGDRIWITPTEMRRVTAAEAEALLSNLPPEPAAAEEITVSMPETAAPELPVEPEVAPEIPMVPEERGTRVVAARENAGLISPEQLQSAATIVGTDHLRILLSQEDEIFIGLGEEQAEVGDQFTIFRTHEKVFDPDTGALLGYHIEVLGWLEIEETFAETSRARIRMSIGDIEIGDHLIPRVPLPANVAVQESPQGVEGKISFFPNNRVLMGFNDFVYLNRGTDDGLEVGSPLEVYRTGYTVREVSRGEKVGVPDRVIAQLLVVRTDMEASVAVVTFSKTDLRMGDRFRGASP